MKAVTAVVVLCLIAYAVAVDVNSDAEGPDWLKKAAERQKRRAGRSSKFTMQPRILPKQHFVPKKHIFTVPNGEASLHADNDGTAWMSPAVELPIAAQNTPSVAPSPLPVSSVPVLKATPGAMCTNAAANIRATPSTSGKVLFTTTNGESLRITASKETSANGYVWVPVSARSQNGYIAKTLLKACSSSTPSSTPASTSSYPLYKQCGQSWSSAQLGSCSGTTVCKAGCAISSISMLLAKRGVSTNPGVLNTWLKGNGGYSGCAVYWAKVDAFGKTKCQGFSNPSYATLCANVKAGYGLILNINNGGHWVLATGCDGKNNVYVNDPGFSKSSYPFSGIVRVVTYK